MDAGVDDEHLGMRDLITVVYDQDLASTNACVAYSMAAALSIFNQSLYSVRRVFDAEKFFIEAGGVPGQTLDPMAALNRAQQYGLCEIATGNYYRIANYVVIYPNQANGQTAIKAAINLGSPCVVALTVPSDFDAQVGRSGDCNATDANPDEPHQVCVWGYTDDRFYFVNTEGTQWGTNGIGSITWDFLSSTQEQFAAYGATLTDDATLTGAPLYPPTTTPTPPTPYTLI
jgi:hypothetical protein